LVVEYSASLSARLAFFVKYSSAIGTAAAIVLCPSFGSMLPLGRPPAFRAGTGAAVINKGY